MRPSENTQKTEDDEQNGDHEERNRLNDYGRDETKSRENET